MTVFFTSDEHHFHKNVCHIGKGRPFDDLPGSWLEPFPSYVRPHVDDDPAHVVDRRWLCAVDHGHSSHDAATACNFVRGWQ